MFEKFDPSKKPVKTIGFDGEMYDSGLEARFANTLRMRGVEYTHNGIAVFAKILGGQYKPDFVWEKNNGQLVVAEVKGYQSDRAIAAADVIRDYCDNPESKITEFVYAWSKGMTLYKNRIEKDAAFYICKDCGKTQVEWFDDPECPDCHSKNQEFLCVDFNTWANQQWEKQWSKTWQRYITKNDWEKKAERYLKNFGAKHAEHLDLVEGGLRLLSEEIQPGQWTPNFYYTEQPIDRAQYGTALAPLAVIVISEIPTNNEKHAHEHLLSHVKNSQSPICKLAIMDRDGIQVADYNNQAKMEKGSWYKCEKCGQVYLAGDKHNDCPCCESKKVHTLSGKE